MTYDDLTTKQQKTIDKFLKTAGRFAEGGHERALDDCDYWEEFDTEPLEMYFFFNTENQKFYVTDNGDNIRSVTNIAKEIKRVMDTDRFYAYETIDSGEIAYSWSDIELDDFAYIADDEERDVPVFGIALQSALIADEEDFEDDL